MSAGMDEGLEGRGHAPESLQFAEMDANDCHSMKCVMCDA